MMKVTITRNTVAGKRPVFVGETHDLDNNEANVLIRMGKAVAAKAPKKKKATVSKKKTGLTTKSAAAIVKGKKA